MLGGDNVSLTIKKLYTENPFVDSLLYCVKILAYGAIIKSEEDANNDETVSTIKSSDLYMAALENIGDFELYEYSEAILRSSSIPVPLLNANLTNWLNDKDLIPTQYRDELVKLSKASVIANYEEKNNYYRMICGLPDYGESGIPVSKYISLFPEGETTSATYIHQMGSDGAKMLELYGIMDTIKADYPDTKYLNYMSAGITIYKARKCIDKQILYLPDSGNPEIDELFRTKYEQSRDFVRRRVNSAAMEYGSEYYQDFLTTYILFLTILDMMSEVQEHIIKKDILDSRCIEFIFDMYGVPYYKIIPIKYQTILCKNINTIVQYKSSPEDMFNFITFFGAEHIEMFKYYILRDRNKDSWGNYLYNEITEYVCSENDVIVHQRYERGINDNTIPMPFEYILQKHNLLYVWVDGYKLVEGVDYTIYNYDKISLNSNWINGHSTIRYDFYYDKDTINQDFTPDTMDSLNLVEQTFTNQSTDNTFTLSLPYYKFLKDGNDILINVGQTFLPQEAYSIDQSNNLVTVDSSYNLYNKYISVIYMYGKNYPAKVDVREVQATYDGQSRFVVPEPFTYYIQNNNSFFITMGSTFVSKDRYTVNRLGYIDFTDGTALDNGRSITFNFIYSKKSIYSVVGIMHTTETVTATSPYQTEFTIHYPVANYLESGYIPYIKLRGWFIDNVYYDTYANTIVLKDTSMGLQPGQTMEIHYIYGPIVDNITVTQDYRVAQSQFQEYFDITFPTSDYVTKGNKVVIDVAGIPLTEGSDYTISGNTVDILNVDYRPFIGKRVNYTFIHNMESLYSINISEQVITATSDNQTLFYMSLPFYPYFETGHGIIVIYKSVIVNTRIISIDKYKLNIDIEGIKAGETINIIYPYNNLYSSMRASDMKVVEKTVNTTEIDDDDIMQVPVPFSGYIENLWPYFLDSNRTYLDESNYEIFDNGLMFTNATDITKLSSITFTFIYKDTSKYLTKTTVEDYDTDMDLKFLKLPLKALSSTDTYVKKKDNTKAYDSLTLADEIWDGESFDPTRHQAIKSAILKKQFNYARTKYLTIDFLKDLSEMSFTISYFYNMLFDDVFKEDLLTISIPTISPYHKFKISHVFCYMISLSYFFKGISDKIMDTPTKIMYCKGFNFKSDLNTLSQYILDERRLPSDYSDVFSFINPTTQIPDIPQFVNIFKTNKKVYKAVVHGMANAEDYDIYSIWKKMYDSLMIWKFNLEYFKLSNGSVASTFANFLKEKDNVLYVSLITLERISDKDTREQSIIQMIQDIIYILDEYIDSKEFYAIYSSFPGVSGEYLLEYLFTMINFFKSYKVVIASMNVDLIIDDPDSNYITPVDVKTPTVKLSKLEYMPMRDTKGEQVHLQYLDSLMSNFRERYSFSYNYSD